STPVLLNLRSVLRYGCRTCPVRHRYCPRSYANPKTISSMTGAATSSNDDAAPETASSHNEGLVEGEGGARSFRRQKGIGVFGPSLKETRCSYSPLLQ